MEVNQKYLDIADNLINTVYKDEINQIKNMDKMFNLDWKRPVDLPDWVMDVKSTDPRDAVITTVRTFSTLRPRFKIIPMLTNNEDNRNRANQVEAAIGWNFNRANKRGDTNVSWDILMSATLYGRTASQVIYLPYQEKILDAMGKNTKRVKMARRFGDFAFITHNARNVFPTWSEYGLESVLTVKVQTFDEFINSWGNLAAKIEKPKDNKVHYVTTFDYWDYEKRVVWGIANDTQSVNLNGDGMKIIEEENKLGFIPYACKRFGNSLSTNAKDRTIPLLQSVWMSGQWDMLNVLSSLDTSLAIKRAAQVQFIGEFPPEQDMELDYTEPVGVGKIPQGTRNFQVMSSQSVDNRVSQGKAEFQSKIWQTSVTKTLQTLEFPSGTAYSSVNQILDMAAKSVSHYKGIGEDTHADLAYLMACWVKYYGKEYKDNNANLYGFYEDKERAGKSIGIPWNEIDPDSMQIEAKLVADVPTDKLQQINGAVMLKNNFQIPDEELMEEIGYTDPKQLRERRVQQDFEAVYIQADQKRIADAQALETAQMQMEMQMGLQQQAMQQEQAARQQEAQAAMAQQGASPANQQLQGQGFNPAAGGTPPVQGARGQG